MQKHTQLYIYTAKDFLFYFQIFTISSLRNTKITREIHGRIFRSHAMVRMFHVRSTFELFFRMAQNANETWAIPPAGQARLQTNIHWSSLTHIHTQLLFVVNTHPGG